MLRGIWNTVRAIVHRRDWESDMEAELRSHMELRAAEWQRKGLNGDEALRRARLEFGSTERYKDEARQSFGMRWFDDLRQDSAYAARSLLRSPGFAVTAILSLALGVGANTVVFGVLDAALFRALPVREPEQLLFVQRGPSPGVSFPAYRDFRDRATSIDGAVAYRVARIGLDAGIGAEPVWGYLATGNYFDVLGLTPAAGRFFHADDEKGINSSQCIVLSYDFWQTRFQRAADVSGKQVRINSKPFTILGVAPRSFRGTEAFIRPDFWIPLAMDPQIEGFNWLEERGSQNAWMIVRARSGVARLKVRAELDQIARDSADKYPKTDTLPPVILASPGLLGDVLREPARQFGLIVMLIAGLALLAACTNLAGLLATRGAERYREIALRLCIGAGRGRIVRQLLTEAVTLTSIAGLAGGATAWMLLRLLNTWRPPIEVPVRLDVSPDFKVFLFSASAALLTGILAGILPARQAWRLDPHVAAKGAISREGSGRLAFRDLILLVQTAVCSLLVVCSLVADQGLLNSLSSQPGFRAKGLSVVSFDPGLAGYERRDGQQFQRRAIDAVSQLPGAASAAYADHIPLDGNSSSTTLFRERDIERRLDHGVEANDFHVSPNYFRTTGTRLIAGREFEWREPQPVAILNETAARELFGAAEAVGGRFQYFNGRLVTVVGVVEDGKYASLVEDPKPTIFQPIVRTGDVPTTLIVRSNMNEGIMAREMEKAVKRLDTQMPLFSVGSATESMGLALLPGWISVTALGAFGALAVMLAITGVYGLSAYSVTRRVSEIGIRMAVGARPSQVLSTVLGRVAILTGGGCVAGIALGVAAGRLLATVVYRASPNDPRTLISGVLVMLAVAVLSALGPARRAISIEPSKALRQD